MALRYCARAFPAVLVAICACLVSGCTMSGIAPRYEPQGLLNGAEAMDTAITVSVIDRIRNAAPVPSSSSSFLGIRYNAPGVQMVCASCAYQLQVPPAVLVEQFLFAALKRDGASIVPSGTKKLEVQVLQFEFFAPKGGERGGLHFEGRVRLHAILSDRGTILADKDVEGSKEFDTGAAAFGGEIEDWVAATVSLAVERALSEVRASSASGRS